MTKMLPTPGVEQTLARLEDARQKWWLNSLLCGLLLSVGTCLGLLFLFVLLDSFLRLSTSWLAVLFLVLLAACCAVFALTFVRSMRRQRSIAGTARRVELAFPHLGSNLINLVQLSENSNGTPESFRQAAVTRAARQLAGVRFDEAAADESRWRRLRYGLQTPRDVAEHSLGFVVLLGAACLLPLLVPTWKSSLSRLLHPGKFVPQVGTVQIVEVTPGDVDVQVGSRLEVAARIENPEGVQHEATLYSIAADGSEEAMRMAADASHVRYSAAFPGVFESFRYRLEIGDSQSPLFTVTAWEKPTFEELEVRYEFPPYLQRQAETLRQKHADLEGPQYTTARLRFHCPQKIARGHLLVEGRTVSGKVSADGRVLEAELQLAQRAGYTVHLFNEAGHTDPQPRLNTIRVTPDAPPTAQLVKPPRESSVALGKPLEVIVRAGDDNGLGEAWLELDGEGDEAEAVPQRIHRWPDLAGATSTTLTHTLEVAAQKFRAGETFQVRAVVFDRRRYAKGAVVLTPQKAVTPWHRVHVVDPAVQAAESLAEIDQVKARLWAILLKQIRARVAASRLVGSQQAADAAAQSRGLEAEQVEIQTSSAALAAGITAGDDEDRRLIKQALGALAHGPMVRAAQQAEALSRIKQLEALPDGVAALTSTQDEIIDRLRRLLDVARKATAEALAELEDRAGGDLPDDVQDKLRDLKDKLDEFVRQQKRVIEATENLAKIPVEDFTEEQEQLLKELAAAEDEWSRFLEDVHSDLSKLPEQDFANASLLEELVEIQTELKMAEGALTKKSAEIAVPLEQLGAEMAEELVSNIEKWLPDTPDRERWSQEEPLTDEMKEAPMAELPGELEDLVGELMEEEEDLFDEMEDASSSWADSLDKGAGWDAADGPISNMSAKGVTGNRLPNTSEIGGRSGEGRQGKSSGEFVGDTAVGKGGRKTPSRLTPDPNVQGQVKDVSKDPVGGATGGGKESGQGGEGLEGPVPNRPPRELQRLAEKQAELRNKAEGVDLKFEVLNYHHTDLKKLIETMAAVERDLQSGRYQSALRRREVLLEGLASVKTYLAGEFQIRQDESANLPADVQKEILGNMEEPSPRGWEELNREYFQRLASPDRAPPEQPAANDGAANPAEPARGG